MGGGEKKKLFPSKCLDLRIKLHFENNLFIKKVFFFFGNNLPFFKND